MELSRQSNFTWLIVASLLAAAGVALGAFGAHGLESFADGRVTDPKKSVEIWATANRYWMYHSLGIGLVGVVSMTIGRRAIFDLSCAFFAVGILLFSGCLHALALTEIRFLGALVPLGGLSMIIGWLTFAFGLVKTGRTGIANGA